jgi:hypothetical protein
MIAVPEQSHQKLSIQGTVVNDQNLCHAGLRSANSRYLCKIIGWIRLRLKRLTFWLDPSSRGFAPRFEAVTDNEGYGARWDRVRIDPDKPRVIMSDMSGAKTGQREAGSSEDQKARSAPCA